MIHQVVASAAGTLIGIAAWNVGRTIRGLVAPRLVRWVLRRVRG